MITSPEEFDKATALVIDVIVDRVVNSLFPSPSLEWFRQHCAERFRWFHANNGAWREWLESRNPSIDPRDQCEVWIRHWWAAYVKDPNTYRSRYDHS